MLKVTTISGALGAIVPPLWVGYGFALKAAGIPWELPIRNIVLMMWLWPTSVPFWEINGRGPIDPSVFAVSLALAVIVNAALYGMIGFLGAGVSRLAARVWHAMARDHADRGP